METPDLLPTRLNFDVVVFSGCTMKEIQTLVIISLITSVAMLGLLTKCLFGMFLVGVGLSFPATIGMTWCLARFLQRLKQGKPTGYVKQSFLLWCEDHGLGSTPYIRRNGSWSVGRRV